jgi:antitoxin YefM
MAIGHGIRRDRACGFIAASPTMKTAEDSAMTSTTYDSVLDNLDTLCEQVIDNREAVIIERPGGNVALIAADDLSSLIETADLLKSPRNAERLLAAYGRSVDHFGEPQTVESLRQAKDF